MQNGVSITKIFTYIIVFFLLLDGSNMWQLISGDRFATNSIRLALLVVCLMSIISTLTIKKVRFTLHFIGNMLAILFLFALFWLGTRYNLLYFFRVQLMVFPIFVVYAYVMMRYGLIRDVAKAFLNLWFIITIVTTTIWFFSAVIPVIPLTGKVYYWAQQTLPTYTFFNLYFANPVQGVVFNGGRFFRNTGIFAESPGVATYYLYAVALELSFFFNDKGHKRRLTTFLIGAASSLSTKALIFIPFILFLNYLFNTTDRRNNNVLFAVRVLALVALVIGLGYGFSEILADKSTTGSYRIRNDDVAAALKVFRENPVFGVGLGNIDPIIRRFTVPRNNNGLSMGLTALMAQGGLWLTTLYLWPMFLSFKRFFFKPKYRRFIIFGIAVFVNLIISNISTHPSFLMLVATGYAYFNLTEEEKLSLLTNPEDFN